MKLRFFVFGILFLILGSPAFAQDWMTDYDAAMSKAIEEDKHVLLFFTGSDWCPPCKKIKRDIYNSDAFIKYAEENLVLLMADFPKRIKNKLSAEQEKKNRKLASRYSPRGFPTTLILDHDGNELNRWVGYNMGSPKAYVEKFDKATRL